jgi:hypothetical protein
MVVKKTVDEMIHGLPSAERLMVKRLRALVLECLPTAIEKPYYGEGVPFYTHHRMICFIWPSSIVWGPKKASKQAKSSGVSLGFCQGNLMSNEDGVLKSEGRKQVYVMYLRTLEDIEEGKIKALLFEAGMIDDSFRDKKRRGKKKL